MLKNHQYLLRILSCGLALCVSLGACFAVAAQETTGVKIEDQPKLSKTEDIQTADVKTEATMGIASSMGIASYYAAKFHGRRTASGEIFHSKSMTAAHRTLPFGTKLKVTNLQNNKFVIVRVNDRGPHVSGRIIDISWTAAELLGMRHTGTARVKLEVLKD